MSARVKYTAINIRLNTANIVAILPRVAYVDSGCVKTSAYQKTYYFNVFKCRDRYDYGEYICGNSILKIGKIRNTATTTNISSITVDVRDYSYYCS